MLTVFIDNTNDSRKKREWKDIPWRWSFDGKTEIDISESDHLPRLVSPSSYFCCLSELGQQWPHLCLSKPEHSRVRLDMLINFSC